MLTSIIGVIFVLSFCIFVHELGHFIAAIISNVKVETFSIGFGKRLFGFERNGCEYQCAIIPFGGYVKMAGESVDKITGSPFEFYSKPVFTRIFITISGVFMNLFFGWLLFFIIFTIGIPSISPIIGDVIKGSPAFKKGLKMGDRIVLIGNTKITDWEDIVKKIGINPNKTFTFEIIRGKKRIKETLTIEKTKEGIGYIGIVPYLKPRIGGFLKGFPGEKSALMVGDVIEAINTKPIFSWDDVIEIVHKNPGLPCSLKIERDNKIIIINIKPKPVLIGTQTIGMLGIEPSFYEIRRYNPIVAGGKAFFEVYSVIVLNIVGIYKMIKGEVSCKMISGPIGIFQIAAKTARQGFIHLIKFTALISICLVIINLIPIPIADGGLIFLFLIEGLRKKPFSKTFYERAGQIGFGIVIFIFLFASMNDLVRIFGMIR